ncbi:MAG: CBS domain-containing protein [Candidatus Saccharimonadales bacterium]
MFHLILAFLLLVLTQAAISLQKTYSDVPKHEIRRRAQHGDASAQILLKALSYGISLQVLLWAIIGVCTAVFFVVIGHLLTWPLALLCILLVLWLSFVWLPKTRVTAVSQKFAEKLSPSIGWLLGYIHPLLEAIGRTAQRYSSPPHHTALYQKEDLLELLERQKKQSDNRMSREEIDIASHALTFGSKLVRDIFIPQSQVVTVNINDTIGPILMGELHKSGHSRFPAYDGKKQNIVGILYLHDLLDKTHGGKVKEVIQKPVNYVHEEQTLYQTLQAFLSTKRHLFVVVNRFEEVIGIITIEDVLEQIIGQPIVDEFDQYEDLRAVAARMADKIHKDQKHQTPQE